MNFEPCIRYFDKTGFAKVYVRLTHKRKVGYIKTRFIANRSQVDGTRIKDFKLLSLIIPLMEEWVMKLNYVALEDISSIIDYLTVEADISFTKHAESYIRKESSKGRDKAMCNYTTSLKSLQLFLKKEQIMFSDITSNIVKKWIDSLSGTKRAKQLYPNCIKKLFKEGQLEYNDFDNNVIIIKHDPFRTVKIPSADEADKKAIPVELLPKIFSFDGGSPRVNLSRDVSMIIFCLAGINTVDLYYMEPTCLDGNKLKYQRRKTAGGRKDSAYMEITIPKLITPLLKKYRGRDRLFSFSEMYVNADNFSSNVNEGLKAIQRALGCGRLTTYSFRHSWATIARNDCGVSMDDVAFCLNHSSAHKVTDGYVKKDFSRVDCINNMVIKKAKLHSPAFQSNK
jgi:hypothetical protein